jgi:23S rRNA (adenine2503-C2)-methyltransferase
VQLFSIVIPLQLIMVEKKKNIRALSLEELKEYFVSKGEKAFRAKQVYDWVWRQSAKSFDDMTNLSLPVRELLDANFVVLKLETADVQKSNDGTIKIAFKLHDGNVVEGVLIPAKDRVTACISSQVGCSLTCSFCATGKMDRVRNLSPDEIYDQVAELRRMAEVECDRALTNIVLMGMGEPLLNYANVVEAMRMVNSDWGLNMAYKRITLSTAGVAKMIKKLGEDQVRFNLALSLHAANDEKRSKIMPINDSNNLEAIAESLIYFYERTGSRITFEYIVFKDFNDEIEDAKELAEFCKHVPCKVNIIEYNPIDGGTHKQADSKKVDAFAKYLESRHIVVNIRRSRGKDIDAACGQLANKNKVAKKA